MISPAEFQQMRARTMRHHVVAGGDEVNERALKAAILNECARRDWIVFHGSMAHRTFRVPGEPDLIVLADSGAVLLIECKTRKGKLSTDQLGIIAWAKKLDHTIHVIRSLQQFNELLEHGRNAK